MISGRIVSRLCDRVGHGYWCVDGRMRYRAVGLSSLAIVRASTSHVLYYDPGTKCFSIHVTFNVGSGKPRLPCSLRAGVTCSSIARPIKSGPEPHKVARTFKPTSRSSRFTHYAICVTITHHCSWTQSPAMSKAEVLNKASQKGTEAHIQGIDESPCPPYPRSPPSSSSPA